MKAIRFSNYGDPGVLSYDDVPTPEPGAGQVRVRVAASAFNPVDDGLRGGYLQNAFPLPLPHIPSSDVSGTVDALGEGVDDLEVGQAVVGFLPMDQDGAAAEFAIAPAEVLASAPTSIPLNDAAAFPSVALTAHQALFEHGKLEAGQRVLVNGAGGAVGGYAVQLAKNAGAYVIATASPRSAERVRAAGADEVIDHTATEVTTSEPVDVLLNLARVEPDELTRLTKMVRDGGVVVNTVPTVPTPSDDARGVRAAQVFVRSDRAQLARIVASIDDGELAVQVDERVPLEELPSIHERATAGTLVGKVIVLSPR